MNKLVSIISPCYNGESYIRRFLDSVLNQTYDNIEFIIVNDGSTDKTEEIVLSYKSLFEDKGYRFCYICQENAGQSAAINKALPVFTGEYMTWLDSDDALPPIAIETKVRYLESHQDCGLLISRTEVVEEKTYKHISYQQRVKPLGIDNLFVDLILGRNVYYSPGGYMVRSSMFRDAMPKPLQIQAPREIGQNYQLLLPIAYKYPHAYIDDVCYIYTIRHDSHSHIRYNFQQRLLIIDIAQDVLKNIVEFLKMTPAQKLEIEKVVLLHKLRNQLDAMYQCRRRDFIFEVEKQIKILGGCDAITKRLIQRVKYPALRFLFDSFSYLKRTFLFFCD